MATHEQRPDCNLRMQKMEEAVGRAFGAIGKKASDFLFKAAVVGVMAAILSIGAFVLSMRDTVSRQDERWNYIQKDVSEIKETLKSQHSRSSLDADTPMAGLRPTPKKEN